MSDFTARRVTAALERPDKLWPVELDKSLHFSIERIRPSKYWAFAVEEDDLAVWDSPKLTGLLENDGVEVELHERELAAVHLKLIPKDVTDHLKRQQLGI